jgi:argonaute-like protein implicated in RNA metabolism and viral defense
MYPGPRVPHPVEILEHHGDSSPDKVCGEIMALTKRNWNNAAFYNKLPITIAFSRQVGHILRDLPAGAVPLPKYRFYM